MAQSVFSEKARMLRKKAGYTQEEVSAKLNIQRQTYSNYENNLRNPPLEIVIGLAELYHVSVDYLVRGYSSAHESTRPPRPGNAEGRLVSEFSTLSDGRKKEVFEFILFKKQLPE